MANNLMLRHFIHTCIIGRRTETRGPDGHGTLTFPAVGTETCRFIAKTVTITLEGQSAQRLRVYKILLDTGSVAQTGDQVSNITLTSTGGTVDANAYRVIGSMPRYDQRAEHHVSAELERVT